MSVGDDDEAGEARDKLRFLVSQAALWDCGPLLGDDRTRMSYADWWWPAMKMLTAVLSSAVNALHVNVYIWVRHASFNQKSIGVNRARWQQDSPHWQRSS